MPALYTSLSIVTALKEANQAGRLQPTTLVSYEAQIGSVFDCRNAAALAAEGMDPHSLAAPTWRDEMRSKGEAATQGFARRLMNAGHHGLIVRSFAPGANASDLNLVLWRWADTGPARLSLIDDEHRLSPDTPP